MKVEKFKVLLYLKKSGTDKSGYYYMRKTLGEFIPWQFKTKYIAFGQLTEQFIHDYQNYVMDVKGLAVDTVRHYLAILKKVCRIAYKEGYAERCHFANFTLPQKTERTPRALSREDFEKIRDVEIPAWRTTHILVRDLFLFACYTGTAYADVVSVTRENLYTDDDGSLWLKYRRKKNELRASVKLLPEALALIEKYHDDNRPTLFPIIYHPNLRRHMKLPEIPERIPHLVGQGGHRVHRHHGGVWKFLQGVFETLQELRSVTDEQMPLLAEQAGVPCRGL